MAAWVCGPAQTSGPPLTASPQPRPERVPDPLGVYRESGFLVGEGRFAPIGRLAFLPASGDSTFAILTLALSNNALKFRRDATGYAASYDVVVIVGDSLAPLIDLRSAEEVRVATFRETSRRDESVVFQALLSLPPGNHRTRVSVEDLGLSAAFNLDTTLAVPALLGPAVIDPILVYQAEPRPDPRMRPDLVASPRATVEFGAEHDLRAYIETVAIPDSPLVLEISTDEEVILTDTLELTFALDSSFATALTPLDHWLLPPGRLQLRARVPGHPFEGRTTLLVPLHGDWLFPDYGDVVDHLQYAGSPEELRSLRSALPADRARLLQEFLEGKDTDPATAVNEFLDRYLRRLQDASDRFGETDTPGWLTDRGAVYVTLGPPDDVLPGLRTEGSAGSQVWVYDRAPAFELRLVFVDTSANGTFRLTAESRRAFQGAVQTVYP